MLVDNVLGQRSQDGLADSVLATMPGGVKGLPLGACLATVLIFAACAAVPRQQAAARESARRHFSHEVVLGNLLERIGWN